MWMTRGFILLNSAIFHIDISTPYSVACMLLYMGSLMCGSKLRGEGNLYEFNNNCLVKQRLYNKVIGCCKHRPISYYILLELTINR